MSENCSLWSLLLSGQKANIQLNLHTATFQQRPIFGRNSIHWHLFRPLYNGHFLLLPRSPFYLLVKVANWSQVSLHIWKSGIWSSLTIWLVTKYHWAYFHLKSTLFLRQYEQQLNPSQIIIYKRLTEINSSYYGLSLMRPLARLGLVVGRYKGSWLYVALNFGLMFWIPNKMWQKSVAFNLSMLG